MRAAEEQDQTNLLEKARKVFKAIGAQHQLLAMLDRYEKAVIETSGRTKKDYVDWKYLNSLSEHTPTRKRKQKPEHTRDDKAFKLLVTIDAVRSAWQRGETEWAACECISLGELVESYFSSSKPRKREIPHWEAAKNAYKKFKEQGKEATDEQLWNEIPETYRNEGDGEGDIRWATFERELPKQKKRWMREIGKHRG